MRPIGGYFGLETGGGKLPHGGAVPVNFGRGGLELIIRERKYRHLWIPDYICPCVPKFLSAIGVEYSTYEIDSNLEPVLIPRLKKSDAFLYVNYFGVKNLYCRKLEKGQPNLILDLTQAFHYVPRRADGFNSARKFFGVPDGGFAYFSSSKPLKNEVELPVPFSYDSCEALLRRADGDLPGGYEAFKASEDRLESRRMAGMSQLTRGLLSACDVRSAYKRRVCNFLNLSMELRDSNLLKFPIRDDMAPLVYPYLVKDGAVLKKHLLSRQIFCPTYWPDIETETEAIENLKSNLVCIPLDQRYGSEDMECIVREIKNG